MPAIPFSIFYTQFILKFKNRKFSSQNQHRAIRLRPLDIVQDHRRLLIGVCMAHLDFERRWGRTAEICTILLVFSVGTVGVCVTLLALVDAISIATFEAVPRASAVL